MLTIHVSDVEMYDNYYNEFKTIAGGTFVFEHSLRAIALWESEWCIPFMTTKYTDAQLMSYYVYMCLSPGFTEQHLIPEVAQQISEYIDKPRSATRIQNEVQKPSRMVMTSEVIYGLMSAAKVPYDCDLWNIHRLMNLLNVISIQNTPKKKMSRQDVYKQNIELNEKRKREYNTKG